ncbi:Gfo/Idh/MocA family protein [Pontiella sulfatireligans]|uniref:Inositol 2-dehydrogenase n=1 Tax=Pontiella sulfatireligans TaxID=2750658 RepID=A0A6C2UWJ8_9BACT|nr:Gfo/Idh/MocA family oxidoreductase [Pontiella sulfatireligans]VGO23564.1 Inositol 2-dehydrogenase [Pontiella sulfatireligans]
METEKTLSRRSALKTGAIIAPFGILASQSLGEPSDKLNVACIGCGGKGRSDVADVAGENIVGLCDVDSARAASTFKKHPDVPKFKDYRRMLEKLDKQIDAVTISTPDHTHYPAAMMAIEMGKHVFVQKPMAHTVWEVRQLMAAAKRNNVVTQMGIQGHSHDGTRRLKEWIAAGAIGDVREIHYWTNRPIWPQGIYTPTDKPAVPGSLDWNLWLGTAPQRAYNPAYAPFAWRGWWDYGCGALGDIGCHAMDAAFWALDLGAPTSVAAETSLQTDDVAPAWSKVTYEFPALGNRPGIKVLWHDGGQKPERPEALEEGRDLNEGIGGQLLYGDKGVIMADTYCKSPRLIPETSMREFMPNAPEKSIPNSPGHMKEFLMACKGEGTPGASFDFSGPLTEMVLLGNLAVRTRKHLKWDSANMRTDDKDANQYLTKAYRKF